MIVRSSVTTGRPPPPDGSSSLIRTTYSPGSSSTVNANGANRCPSAVVANPEATVSPSRDTSHSSVASNTAATPVTSTVRPTTAPWAGASICTGDRVAYGSPRRTGSRVATAPNSSSTGAPSSRIRTGSVDPSAPCTVWTSCCTAISAPAVPSCAPGPTPVRSTVITPSAAVTGVRSRVPAGQGVRRSGSSPVGLASISRTASEPSSVPGIRWNSRSSRGPTGVSTT